MTSSAGGVASPSIKVVTINMHKGLSPLKVRSTVHRLRQKIREHHADLVFIQELQQETGRRTRQPKIGASPGLTQFMAEGYWPDWHYGKNASYSRGHHGNAILSQHPMRKGLNYDISAYRFEKRGLLHSLAYVQDQTGQEHPIHCFCVHLALFERGRKRQLGAMIEHINALAKDQPAIVAGDFNDWRNRVGETMSAAGFREAFESMTGAPAKTFPSAQPLLAMDRIYVRGMAIASVELLHDWAHLSDHLGLAARIHLPALGMSTPAVER